MKMVCVCKSKQSIYNVYALPIEISFFSFKRTPPFLKKKPVETNIIKRSLIEQKETNFLLLLFVVALKVKP